LNDVLRLSRGMTYKSAITGLPLGGGKSVIIGDSRKIKTPELMKAMGRAVDAFAGRYIIAEDVGTTVDDLNQIATQTKHAVGVSHGGHGGDPSPVTAYGVYVGLKAAVKNRLGTDDLRGLTVAVQGLGNVGYNLCRHLHKDGAKLFVTDVQTERVNMAVQEFGATAVGLNDIYDVPADVFAPCALGAILNDDTIPRIKAKVIAGAANNQLANNAIGDEVTKRGILYAPDYAVNAGGVMNVALELDGYNRERAMRMMRTIYHNLHRIYEISSRDEIPISIAPVASLSSA
jgi:leucine dehydrogenase